MALPSTSSRLPINGVRGSDKGRSHPLRDDPERVEREVFESELPGLEIHRRIGRGGMGMVFRARQRLLDRDVAVKVIPFLRSPAPELVRRFKDEARLAARLRHPGVAWVVDAGSTPRFLYLVLEYVAGRDLALELLERRTLSESEALGIAEQIGWALHHAHQCGVVHQDLKPANVIIRPDGQAVVTDFGLAASLDGLGGMVDHPRLFGTLPFLPPEDLQRGRRVPSAGADLYALGVTLFRMLTGRLPYASTSISELIQLTGEGPPRAASHGGPPISEGTQQLLARAMAPDSGARFSSARELVEAIVSMRQGGEEPPP